MSYQQHSVIFKLVIHILTSLTTTRSPVISSHPENVICTVHTTSCYELNRHTLKLFINLLNIITLKKHQLDNLTTDINTLTQNIPHHSFLSSLIVLKILTYKASSEIMIPSARCIYSVP